MKCSEKCDSTGFFDRVIHCELCLLQFFLFDCSSVLVTGASGGVGVTAVALLASLGYRVTASSGRQWTYDTLTKLGSAKIIDRFPDGKVRAIDKEVWDGVVDSVGGVTLAKAISQCK